MTQRAVSVGDQVFTREGGEEFGSVRYVHPHELVIDIEGAGDFTIPASAVTAVHDGKIIVDKAALSQDVVRAIAAAHKQEEPGK